MTNFTDLQTKRRSIYALGKNVELSNQELVETIQAAILQTPSAFHSQTTRVVILLLLFYSMMNQIHFGMKLLIQN